MTRYAHLIILALLLGLLPLGAQAQEAPPVRFEAVVAGYDGIVRRNQWFPVGVTVSNDGPDLRGELIWEGGGATYRRAIDLPRGARKQLTLLALEERNFRNNGMLTLAVGGQRVIEQQVRLSTVDDDVYLVGVISDDPGLLGSLASLRLPNWSRVALVRLGADQVPEQWAGLAMLNALFVGGPGSDRWSDAQRAAVSDWIDLGGQLVVGGGVNADQIAAGLGDLLPVELGGGLAELSLQPLAGVARTSRSVEPAQASVRVATPREGATMLAEGPLMVAQRRGAGQVLFAAFDLATLRGWTQEEELWGAALNQRQLVSLGASYRRDGDNLLQSVLQLPGLGLPSVWSLLAYLLGYVLLIGPANYLVLRRLDRREWAWVTVPLTVLLFTLGTYALGFGVRGSSVLFNQVALVHAREGSDRGAVTAFLGMYSPRRTSYTVTLPGTTLVSDLASFDGAPGGPSAPLAQADRVVLENVLVDVGSLRTLVAEDEVALPFRVESRLRSDGLTLEGEVRVDGASLQQAVIVRGENALPLGDFAAGQTQPVQLQLNSDNFPWGSGATTEGIFNRQQILNSVFSPGRFTPFNAAGSPLREDETYLLAWAEQPQITAEVEGGAFANELTLYIVHLKEAVTS